MSGLNWLQRLQPDRCANHEHAGVPVEAAVGQIALGGGQIGLLDELRHLVRAAAGVVGADVAEAGFRPIGRDAEDHDLAVGGNPDRLLQRAA